MTGHRLSLDLSKIFIYICVGGPVVDIISWKIDTENFIHGVFPDMEYKKAANLLYINLTWKRLYTG